MTALPALRPTRQAVVTLQDRIAALLADLADQPAPLALAAIDRPWRDAPPGLGQRVLTGARVALMRRQLTEGSLPSLPPLVPLPELPTVVETLPEAPPAPKPASRSSMMMLNLADAARMLTGGDEDEVADETGETVAAQAAAPDPVTEALALADAVPAPVAAATPKAKPRKGRAKVLTDDPLALLAAIEDEAPAPAAAAAPPAPRRGKVLDKDLADQFAVLALTETAAVPARAAEAEGVSDPAEEPPDAPDAAPSAPRPKPAFDLSAQFAAMEGD